MSFDLKAARLNAGFSQRGLAHELDVAPGTVGRLEAGKAVHPATARKVADYFDIRVVDLRPAEAQA